MRIFGWAASHNGCGQYRIGLPMWALQQAGHDATAFSVLNVDVPDDLDVLVGQIIMEPERTQVWQALAARRDRRTALVFEIDDDIWNIHHSNTAGLGFTDPEVQATIEQNIALADAVTVTTQPLADRVSQWNPNVHVIPNCVDAALLGHERPRREQVTLGWSGGSSHANDFDFVSGELRSFLRRNPAVDVHLIGADYRKALGRPDARWSGWDENLVAYLCKIDFDIAVVPVAYHAFNKSKSDLKALEYAALGIPIVASDFGPYTESVQHGVTGFLVKRPHEWATYLRDLVNDEQLRRELGDNARRWAATRTIQANVWRWETAYQSIVGSVQDRSPAFSAGHANATAIASPFV